MVLCLKALSWENNLFLIFCPVFVAVVANDRYITYIYGKGKIVLLMCMKFIVDSI